MLSHESLRSYYNMNNELLFRDKERVFDQNMSLTELEEMLPFERFIYLILINNKIQERENKKSNSK